MRFNARFFKLTAICSSLSGLTTLGVHLLPRLYAGPNDFERLVSLHANPIYLARLWIIVLHILLVVAAMWGVAAKKLKSEAGVMILGLLGYLLFAAAEAVPHGAGALCVESRPHARLMCKRPTRRRGLRCAL